MTDIKIYFNVDTKKRTKVFLFLTMLPENFAYICGVLNVGDSKFVRYAKFQFYRCRLVRKYAPDYETAFARVLSLHHASFRYLLFFIQRS